MPETLEITRCRSCGGFLTSEEPFELQEACGCPTKQGRRARVQAARHGAATDGLGEPKDLAGMLSDSGLLW